MTDWKITSMESQPDTGIVVSAKWVCTALQDDKSASVSGTSVFPEPSDTFMPYPQLTEDVVLGWCWSDGGVDKQIVESSVANALQAQLEPTIIVQELPWVQ